MMTPERIRYNFERVAVLFIIFAKEVFMSLSVRNWPDIALEKKDLSVLIKYN